VFPANLTPGAPRTRGPRRHAMPGPRLPGVALHSDAHFPQRQLGPRLVASYGTALHCIVPRSVASRCAPFRSCALTRIALRALYGVPLGRERPCSANQVPFVILSRSGGQLFPCVPFLGTRRHGAKNLLFVGVPDGWVPTPRRRGQEFADRSAASVTSDAQTQQSSFRPEWRPDFSLCPAPAGRPSRSGGISQWLLPRRYRETFLISLVRPFWPEEKRPIEIRLSLQKSSTTESESWNPSLRISNNWHRE
jgi:hypothetical protein